MSDINLIISATDSASPVLKRINKQIDQFNRNGAKAQKSGRALSGALKGIGIAAAAIGIGKLASGLVGTITKFESLKAGLKTVTGSAMNASIAFKQIQDFTATTPFQLDEVTNAFTILKRNGIDTSTESLEAFGNIAAANGKSFEQLAEAVADGLTGEFERLKEFGIKVRKENDKFVASMGDTQVAASGSAKELMESLKSLGEEGGRYATGISDQAATMGGKFSNLKDNITQFAASIGQGGLASALKDTMDLMNNAFSGEGVMNFAKTIGAGLGAAINVTVAKIGGMAKIFQATFTFVKELVQSVFKNNERAIEDFRNDVATQLNAIKRFFKNSFEFIFKIVKVTINALVNTFRYMYESAHAIITQLPQIFKDVFVGIGRLAGDFSGRFVQQFVNLGEGAAMAFQAAFSSEISFQDALATATKNAFSGFDMMASFSDFSEVGLTDARVKEIFGTDAVGAAVDLFNNAVDSVKDRLNAMGITIDTIQTASGLTLFSDFMAEFNRLSAEGASEQEALDAALAATTASTAKNTAETGKNNRVKSTALTYAQKLSSAYSGLIAQVTKTTEQDKINADLLPKINQAYADGTINLAQYSEGLQKIGSNFEPLQVKAQRTADTIKQSMAQMAGAIGDQFFDMFIGVTSVFDGLKNIAKMVLQMVMKAIIQAFIVKPLLMAMGIPMFANGGIANAGEAAIVGENGPELIVPNKDSRIFSNSKTREIMGSSNEKSPITSPSMNGQSVVIEKEPLTVNFNLTSVDTKSGVQFLLENKQTITGMVQQAYNKRGVRGPLG